MIRLTAEEKARGVRLIDGWYKEDEIERSGRIAISEMVDDLTGEVLFRGGGPESYAFEATCNGRPVRQQLADDAGAYDLDLRVPELALRCLDSTGWSPRLTIERAIHDFGWFKQRARVDAALHLNARTRARTSLKVRVSWLTGQSIGGSLDAFGLEPSERWRIVTAALYLFTEARADEGRHLSRSKGWEASKYRAEYSSWWAR